MVHTHDESVNIRADIQATRTAMDGYIRTGAYRRAAKSAQHLAYALEKLANLEMPNDRTRTRRVAPPPPPESGDEFLSPRLQAFRRAGREAGMPVPPRRPPERHIQVTEVKREPPALPEG